MKKTLSLVLNKNDAFFVQLEEKIINTKELGWSFDTAPISSKIVQATLNMLKSELKDMDTKEVVEFTFIKKENIYPHFHANLENEIDKVLNGRVHSTTRETLAELVEEHMLNYIPHENDMNYSLNNKLIDTNHELESMVQYIAATWDGFEDIKNQELFKQVWDYANSLLKNHFDKYFFLDMVQNLSHFKDKPTIIINQEIKSTELAMYFIISQSELAQLDTWDYSKNVKSILSSIKSDFPEAKNARPKNWKQFSKNYEDYDGMEELDETSLNKLFKGTQFSSSFALRTSLPHVMYDDKCQGRKPLEVLVGAIVGHAYEMNEKNNSEKMLKEWLELDVKLKQLSTESNNVREINFEFKEPLNQALVSIMAHKGEIKPEVLDILGLSKKKLKP